MVVVAEGPLLEQWLSEACDDQVNREVRRRTANALLLHELDANRDFGREIFHMMRPGGLVRPQRHPKKMCSLFASRAASFLFES